jgi:hypothetical protein
MHVRSAFGAALLLLVGACAQMSASEPQQAQGALPPPLFVEGGYITMPMRDMWCPRCANFPGRWLSHGGIDVYAEPRINAQIVDQLAEDEWVNAVRYERHLRAQRGVVLRAAGEFHVGDEVYSVGRCFDEETCDTLISHNGRVVEFLSGRRTPDIEYAPLEDPFNSNYMIDWVYVERDGGRRNGWIRDLRLSGIGEQ